MESVSQLYPLYLLSNYTPSGYQESTGRENTYEEIWSDPVRHVAKRYGISDVGRQKSVARESAFMMPPIHSADYHVLKLDIYPLRSAYTHLYCIKAFEPAETAIRAPSASFWMRPIAAKPDPEVTVRFKVPRKSSGLLSKNSLKSTSSVTNPTS